MGSCTGVNDNCLEECLLAMPFGMNENPNFRFIPPQQRFHTIKCHGESWPLRDVTLEVVGRLGSFRADKAGLMVGVARCQVGLIYSIPGRSDSPLSS